MCGIVGFTGRHKAAPILLDGLSKLEYRGYDSAGIAVRDGEKDIEIIKAKGDVYERQVIDVVLYVRHYGYTSYYISYSSRIPWYVR